MVRKMVNKFKYFNWIARKQLNPKDIHKINRRITRFEILLYSLYPLSCLIAFLFLPAFRAHIAGFVFLTYLLAILFYAFLIVKSRFPVLAKSILLIVFCAILYSVLALFLAEGKGITERLATGWSMQLKSADFFKTGFTTIGGLGAIILLVLKHGEQKLAESTYLDDRISNAVDKLSNEFPHKQICGVYGLIEIADKHHNHRQQAIDILCCYLRTPKVSEGSTEVISAIINSISEHLRAHAWEYDSIDFHGITIKDTIDVSYAWIKSLNLSNSKLQGSLNAGSASFEEHLTIEETHFYRDATFDGAYFSKGLTFSPKQTNGAISFKKAVFFGAVNFEDCPKQGEYDFEGAEFFSESKNVTTFPEWLLNGDETGLPKGAKWYDDE